MDYDNDFHGGLRALLVDDEGNKWLQGSDGSTGRVYTMSAKKECENCIEAHESLWPDLKEDMRIGQS